jgi:hypothetical protein
MSSPAQSAGREDKSFALFAVQSVDDFRVHSIGPRHSHFARASREIFSNRQLEKISPQAQLFLVLLLLVDLRRFSHPSHRGQRTEVDC